MREVLYAQENQEYLEVACMEFGQYTFGHKDGFDFFNAFFNKLGQ